MTAGCGHRLCEIIGGTCSLATGRSRGCTPSLASREVAPETFDEVRTLLVAIESGPGAHTAAVRLAAILRREALEDRILLAAARSEEPDLVAALEHLCVRQR